MSCKTPSLYFHVSASFHHWFIYHKGDFPPDILKTVHQKVRTFEPVWNQYEKDILYSIPHYTGVTFPYTEIHVYYFVNPSYRPIPCIPDPVCINMAGNPDINLILLYLIHELVHVNIQFCNQFNALSLTLQEVIAYTVGNQVLKDILKEKALPIIKSFTIPWPYNFPHIAQHYTLDLTNTTILNLIKTGELTDKPITENHQR
ncbi:MAG: hypothetical protein PVF58_17730 [Candidatus Methanofastidiosia archaeon]|jgi:hypothetical protein